MYHQGLLNGIKSVAKRHSGLRNFNVTNKTNKQPSFKDRYASIVTWQVLFSVYSRDQALLELGIPSASLCGPLFQ
jgi:hypothetical protein